MIPWLGEEEEGADRDSPRRRGRVGEEAGSPLHNQVTGTLRIILLPPFGYYPDPHHPPLPPFGQFDPPQYRPRPRGQDFGGRGRAPHHPHQNQRQPNHRQLNHPNKQGTNQLDRSHQQSKSQIKMQEPNQSSNPQQDKGKQVDAGSSSGSGSSSEKYPH